MPDTPMFETHTPVDATPSAIATALANYRPAEPEPPREKSEAERLRVSLRRARRDRDHLLRRVKRLEKQLNAIKEIAK